MPVNQGVYEVFDSVYVLVEYDHLGERTGLYKIGYSGGSTANRSKQYRAGNSRAVKELYTVFVPDGCGRAVESKIHNKFWANHIPPSNKGGGVEWFQLSDTDLQQVLLEMFKYEQRRDRQVPRFAMDTTANLDETASLAILDEAAAKSIVEFSPRKEAGSVQIMLSGLVVSAPNQRRKFISRRVAFGS